MQASKNFTIEELCASVTAKTLGIDNTPTDEQIRLNLTALATAVLQPLRDYVGGPIRISSGYRCEKLNKSVGGSKTSQHLKGEAVDIDLRGDVKKGREMFDYIRDHLEFDQLIFEHNTQGTYWVHVSYSMAGNRHQVIDEMLKKDS